MMNHMPSLPNFYCVSTLQGLSYVPVAPHKQISSFGNMLLLNTISQALSLSLKNYQQQLLNNLNLPEKHQNQGLLAKEKLNKPEKVIEIIISEEEEGEKTQYRPKQNTTKNIPK